ncbi:MAG: phosphotransferase, partial [Acidobacteriaceae bacterium]|nr:phosphotransferase [Acidobacteriaceae bacterium]
QRIRRFLHESRLAPPDARVTMLTGDASDRRYVRVTADGQSPIVLALHAAPFDYNTLPFANVAGLLHRMPVAAPRILGHSNALGVLALTDLGDVTLQAHLEETGGADRLNFYEAAIDLIDVLQRRGRELADEQYLPYSLAFDVEKLTWELEFFVRHFLEAHRGVTLTTDQRATLTASFADIAHELADEPRVLCHRDYHSRNLMLQGRRLHIIDFQDARLGPDTYDLVSLLRDSYVELADEDVALLIAYFLGLQHRTGETAEFRRRFDLMALQRNLKALGTFGYMATSRQNAAYVQYVPRTLGYVRQNLQKYARFAALRHVLAAHLPELA